MERATFGILVLSGLCHCASSLHDRQYYLINELKTWHEAQQYCREKHTDLATINDVQDLRELVRLMAGSRVPNVYIGLYRSWGWSLSDADDYKQGELAYWNWASEEPVKHYCGSIGSTGEWFATNCSSTLNYFCYNESTTDISERFILGKDSMNWSAAQEYCRDQHTDLARVRNQLENEQLQKIMNSSRVWIGLTGAMWSWSDGSEPMYTPWTPNEPLIHGLADCAILVSNRTLGLIDVRCDLQTRFICYAAPLKKLLLRLKLTADDSSVDMTDPTVRESILKWVEKKLRDKGTSEDVKLSWRKFPEKETNKKQEETHCDLRLPEF